MKKKPQKVIEIKLLCDIQNDGEAVAMEIAAVIEAASMLAERRKWYLTANILREMREQIRKPVDISLKPLTGVGPKKKRKKK